MTKPKPKAVLAFPLTRLAYETVQHELFTDVFAKSYTFNGVA
jgi:hypothetical protein